MGTDRPGCEHLGAPGELSSWCAWAELGEEASGCSRSSSGAWALPGTYWTLMCVGGGAGLRAQHQRQDTHTGKKAKTNRTALAREASSGLEGVQTGSYSVSPWNFPVGSAHPLLPPANADPQPCKKEQ